MYTDTAEYYMSSSEGDQYGYSHLITLDSSIQGAYYYSLNAFQQLRYTGDSIWYINDSLDKWYLSWDYSLNIGDTFYLDPSLKDYLGWYQATSYYTIVQIDSVEISNIWRKRVWARDSLGNQDVRIQGIGSARHGPLHRFQHLVSCCDQLMVVCSNTGNLLPIENEVNFELTSNATCEYARKLSVPSTTNAGIVIFPNPTKGVIKFKNLRGGHYSFLIMDPYGRTHEEREQYFHSNTDLKLDLAAGLYTIILKSEDSHSQVFKIMVH